MSLDLVVAGPLRDPEQTFQGSSEEHRQGDKSRDNGGCRAGEDAEQFSGGRLRGVTAGWCGGETQRPEEEGEGFRRALNTHFHTAISHLSTFKRCFYA